MNWFKLLIPYKFDENEIYIIFIILVVGIILFYLQKKYKCLSAAELIFIWAFDNIYGIIGDYFLGLKPLDLYDTFDHADADLGDALLHITAYPGVVLIFVCLYALSKSHSLKKAALILAGALTGAIVEHIGTEFFNLYRYKRWNIYYSFMFYILVFYINFFIYDKVHKYILRKKKENSTLT